MHPHRSIFDLREIDSAGITLAPHRAVRIAQSLWTLNRLRSERPLGCHSLGDVSLTAESNRRQASALMLSVSLSAGNLDPVHPSVARLSGTVPSRSNGWRASRRFPRVPRVGYVLDVTDAFAPAFLVGNQSLRRFLELRVFERSRACTLSEINPVAS